MVESSEVVVTASLVEHVRKFLGEVGAKFFADVKRDHGRYDAVWVDDGIPHMVHSQEGMQVRNAMRRHQDCKGWNAHDFDETWVRVVEACLAPGPLPDPIVVAIHVTPEKPESDT